MKDAAWPGPRFAEDDSVTRGSARRLYGRPNIGVLPRAGGALAHSPNAALRRHNTPCWPVHPIHLSVQLELRCNEREVRGLQNTGGAK